MLVVVYSQEDHWQCQAGGAVVAPTDRAGIQSNFTERLAETSQSSTKVNVKLRIWDEIIPCDSTGETLSRNWLCQEGFQCSSGQQGEHEPAVCPCSKEP